MRKFICAVRAGWTVVLVCIVSYAPAQQIVVGYVSNEASAVQVDYSRITHLNIAFLNPTDARGTLSFTTWDFKPLALNSAYVTDARSHGVKVLASMAGGSASENASMKSRYFDLISDANRAAFITRIISYVNAHNLDGIDVDLEGSSINADYGKFIEDLSKALKSEGKLLTAALSHLNGGDNVPSSALAFFDYLNIMAYDRTGPWNPENAGQHSSMEFAIESLEFWTGRGLEKSKCILGVPFYGYSFGTSSTAYSYSQLVDAFDGAGERDVVTDGGNTIYYNGMPTIRQKAQYVVDEGYGGIMIWNLAHDKPSSDEKSLLRVITSTIHIDVPAGVGRKR